VSKEAKPVRKKPTNFWKLTEANTPNFAVSLERCRAAALAIARNGKRNPFTSLFFASEKSWFTTIMKHARGMPPPAFPLRRRHGSFDPFRSSARI
jgi:hypothetical protein